jgi:hypothetical protein
MKGKLSRREVIKVLAAAGAALAAAPYLPKVAGNIQTQNLRLNANSKGSTSKDPLVILVKENELLAFRGLEEFRIIDPQLANQLAEAFQAGRATD